MRPSVEAYGVPSNKPDRREDDQKNDQHHRAQNDPLACRDLRHCPPPRGFYAGESGITRNEGLVDSGDGSWHFYAMTTTFILVVALVAGVFIQSRWALLLPLAIGACVAIAIAATGHGLGDTPIPFLVVVRTLVMVGGQGLRSQVISPIS
jgi:hypothetical protein